MSFFYVSGSEPTRNNRGQPEMGRACEPRLEVFVLEAYKSF